MVTSIFFFSHNVFFKRLPSQSCNKSGLCTKEFNDWLIVWCLTLSQTSPGFYVSAVQVFRKHWGKRRNCSLWAIFSFFHSVFYPFGELFSIFIKFKIVVCKLFQFGKGPTPFSTVVQLYHQCTYPCFPGVLLTSTPHNILSKPLAAFPHNHRQNNGLRWVSNESCHNKYHQSSLRMLAEPGIKPATSCSQVRY